MNIICVQLVSGEIHYVDITIANQKYYTFCERYISKEKAIIYGLDNHVHYVCDKCNYWYDLYLDNSQFRKSQSHIITHGINKYHESKSSMSIPLEYDNLMNRYWRKLKKIKRKYNAAKK